MSGSFLALFVSDHNILYTVIIHEARSVDITPYTINAAACRKLPNNETDLIADRRCLLGITGEHERTVKEFTLKVFVVIVHAGIYQRLAPEMLLHSLYKCT